MGRIDGKVALVTGGASGMGAAEVRLFAAEGASVVIGDVADDAGRSLAAELGDGASYVHLDVTSEADWTAAVESVVAQFGSLDVLVNNAGIAEPAPLAEMTLESYRRVVDVNQVGVFLGMKAVLAPMTATGNGSIINISSIDGMAGMDHLMSYVASKWAVRGMTKAAAMELAASGIRVNSIHPGFILTPMGSREGVPAAVVHATLEAHSQRHAPMGRAGQPEEIAHLALFLASDDSSYSTGSEFVADGGLTAGHRSPGVSR
jgi:3alpha(or 20beta)-hydroxysteroid dehydrogenase